MIVVCIGYQEKHLENIPILYSIIFHETRFFGKMIYVLLMINLVKIGEKLLIIF